MLDKSRREAAMKTLTYACVILVAVVGIAVPSLLSAQAPTPTPSKELAATFQRAATEILDVAEVMPAEKYGYKPTPEISSFGDQLVHVAGITQRFIDTAKGIKTEPAHHGPMAKPEVIALPLAAEAQKSEKLPHVGILGLGPTPSPQELARSVSTNPFWQSMRQLGWVDGQNMVVERRFGESPDQLRRGAAELVRLKVDVLFVSSAGLAKILQLETKTIPIVVGRADNDLVAAGLVDSLARPGGNITGSQLLNDELIPKRLELLKTLVPNLSKVALLREDVTTSALPQIRDLFDQQVASAARSLGIEVHTFVLRHAPALAPPFLGIKKNHDQGVVVMSPAFMFVHRRAVIDLAATHRIPAIYELRVFVEPGGLMSYGVDASEMQRRAAGYLDKILKGAKPADLPVEQPTNFELVINLKTAKTLGLTIPQSLLVRADEIIHP